MNIWRDPVVGEVLLLEREPDNVEDERAVAVKEDGQIVGHLPKLLSPTVCFFLTRTCNKGVAEVTGSKINRGAGYGLEILGVYRFYGPSRYLRRLSGVFDINQMMFVIHVLHVFRLFRLTSLNAS